MTTVANNTYYEQLNKLDPMERELYRILKTFADNTTKQCFPSIASLSKLFKRCRNTTKKYIRQLEFKGFIHVKQQRVTHKVTNNKYNDTNLYTLLLEKFKNIVPVSESTENDNKVVELKETRLDTITSQLKTVYSNDVVVAALKTMRKNMRNGSIISNMKNYLEALITKSNNQLEEVNKAIEISNKTSNSTSNNKHQVSNKSSANNYKTKFHNFESRTKNYNADELEAKILANHKRK